MAANLGYSVALVERDTVGGTVVTNGGAPTKTFREAALYLSAFEKEKIYGISLAAPPEVMYPAVAARARAVSEILQQATLDRLRALGVQLVYGAARLEDGHTVIARSSAGEETRLHGKRVVLATGSRPLRPASVPFEDRWVFDSEEIMEIGGRPRDILIVGGGPIGVEYATIFSALGVPVTLLDAAPRLLMMMDEEISRRLEQVFLERGVQVITGTGMASVRAGRRLICAPSLNDGRELRPAALLFAAGRSVDTSDLGLDAAGIEVDGRGRVVVDERGQTSCPSVCAAGDVIGPALASLATDQGRQAVCGAFDLDFSVHVDQLPVSAVYGMPEVARAGMTEQDCEAAGIPYEIGRCELGSTPRGVIAGEEGLLKLVFRRADGALVGVHVIGPLASELVGPGQAMIHGGATIEDVVRMGYNTPTYTYGYKLAGIDALRAARTRGATSHATPLERRSSVIGTGIRRLEVSMPDLPLVPGRDLNPEGAVAASQQLRVTACSPTVGLLVEGPRWIADRDELLWVDIIGSQVHRARVGADGLLESPATMQIDRHVGAAAPAVAGGYVVAAGTGFLFADTSGAICELAQPETGRTDVRMNDGACDPQGRFWAGTMAYDESPGKGALYRLELDGSCTTVLTGLTISNGIGWSPDGTTMYLADSGTGTIDAFTVDPSTGDLDERRSIVRIEGPGCAPDGLTVDDDGDIWVAIWVAARCAGIGLTDPS